ncbi:MAG TPA: outer membrane beta-barrel family protein [Puia sp.]|nr:outer membrane beta-barrel family protein [Puia sp.]
MKILLRLNLSGCLFILINVAAFSQDSTRKLLPSPTADTVVSVIPGNVQNTDPHARLKDSIPAATKDSTLKNSGTLSADSTHVISGDSVRRPGRTSAAASVATGFSGSRRNGNGRQSPAIGHFYGRIVDAKTNKGLDGTSVQLVMAVYDTTTHSRRDSVVRGAITPSNGDFSFENLPILGNYVLKLTAIGYKAVNQRVAFNLKDAQSTDPDQRLGAIDKDLGNIKMEIDPTSLQQVTVTADKPLIQLGIDRKVYNVEKDISASGGTAVDIMKNIPSLAVDIDGNVTLRNAPPTIFVDGRPTTLTLEQIPADEIESVEIITNPGAKFDASGGVSGILNIVMKKNRKAGYNGSIRAGIDKRGGYNLGGNLNVKEGKFNFFGSANVNHRKTISPGTTDRLTFISDPEYQLHQQDSNVNNSHFAFGRLGFDYFLDNRNTFTVTGTLVHGTSKPYTNSNITQDTIYKNGYSNSSFTQRFSNNNTEFNNKSGMLSFKHNFPRSGEEWTADANYTHGETNSVNQTNSYLYDNPDGPLSGIYKQQTNSSAKNEYITAQTDFTNPFTEKSKLEAGGRVAIRNIGNLNNFYTIDSTGNLIYQPLLSSNYNYHDQVLAGYLQYSNTVGKFGFQLGLRAENSSYRGTNSFAEKDPLNPGNLKDTLGSFSNSYPISLFPSVFLTQKLNDDQSLQLNYTRRIDRPSFLQLSPYTDYSDSLNLSRGNPNLKPQFTNSFEMSYQLNYQKNTFLSSIYYKYTTDLITRYQTKELNPLTDSIVLINTYINANSSYIGGLELIGRNSLTSWWDLTTNLNFYTSKINAGDSIQTAPASISWFAKINMTFKIPKNFTFQVTGDYTSKTVLPPGGSAGTGGGGRGGTVSGNAQGYSLPTGGVDASLKYEFLKNKAASLTLSVNDIFATRRSDVFINSQYSNQHTVRYRDPQFFRLQFNYRFGKVDVSLFKRKSKQEDPENLQNGSDTPLNQ